MTVFTNGSRRTVSAGERQRRDELAVEERHDEPAEGDGNLRQRRETVDRGVVGGLAHPQLDVRRLDASLGGVRLRGRAERRRVAIRSSMISLLTSRSNISWPPSPFM